VARPSKVSSQLPTVVAQTPRLLNKVWAAIQNAVARELQFAEHYDILTAAALLVGDTHL
jgi:hypothetical protein